MTLPVPSDSEHKGDKRALFLLAALVVCVLGMIVGGVFFTKIVPDKGDVLLGGISTGLILFLQRLVDAVRSSWDAVTQAKTLDTLGKSGPVVGSEPQAVTVVNETDNPVPVQEPTP